MNKNFKILTFVATCMTVGYFSGLVTRSAITTWYPTLIKPIFNPPNWIFAPVWSLLYVLMGIAAGLVWNQIENEKEAVKLESQKVELAMFKSVQEIEKMYAEFLKK